MACIDKKYCRECKKETEHISYPDNYYGEDAGCQECLKRKMLEMAEAQEEAHEMKRKQWAEMCLEEKIEDLNKRLEKIEMCNMMFK